MINETLSGHWLGVLCFGSLKKHFDGLMFETVIPRNKDVEEAHGNKMSVLTYAPKSRGAEAYRALAKEVIARE